MFKYQGRRYRYRAFNHHKDANTVFPPFENIEDIRDLAEAYAQRGQDALIRVFSPNLQVFITSFSVLDGVVVEHKDVTIPARHW